MDSTFKATSQLPPVSRDPEYEKFIQETGFEFERDLDQAAFAIHYPQSWGGGTGGSASEPRFSEVFVGKIDPAADRVPQDALVFRRQLPRFDIYKIPIEGRTVRVAVLSDDSVAVSNHAEPDVIHGMIDRSRRLASPFGGPSFLRDITGECRWRACRLHGA